MCTSLTEFEVERAKNALKTNMLLHLDGTAGSCEDIGRQMLCYGKRYSPAEMVAKVDNVDASLVRDVCFNYLYDQDPVIGKKHALKKYDQFVQNTSYFCTMCDFQKCKKRYLHFQKW